MKRKDKFKPKCFLDFDELRFELIKDGVKVSFLRKGTPIQEFYPGDVMVIGDAFSIVGIEGWQEVTENE